MFGAYEEKNPEEGKEDPESSDNLDFDRNRTGKQIIKPASYMFLSYEKWRKEIIPAIQNSFMLTEEIADDDLHEFEDVDIYQT